MDHVSILFTASCTLLYRSECRQLAISYLKIVSAEHALSILKEFYFFLSNIDEMKRVQWFRVS